MIKFNAGSVRIPIVERPLLWTRFQPFLGDTVLEPDEPVDPKGHLWVAEMSVFRNIAGEIDIWYSTRVNETPITYGICRAVAPDINSPFVFDQLYVGDGQGGTSAGHYYQGSYVWQEADGTYWMIATNGYAVTPTSRDGKCRIFSAATLAGGFTNHGVIIQQSMFPETVVCMGNVALVLDTNNRPVQIGGKYYALVEALSSGSGYWKTFVGESTSLLSGWSITHTLTTAQPVANAMWGGMWAMLIDGVIHFAYHYGSQVGDIPTLLAYATSTDNLLTATIREAPFAFYHPSIYGTFADQAADPWFVEIDGISYLFYEVCANFTAVGFQSYIVKKSFPGTLSQAFDGIRLS